MGYHVTTYRSLTHGKPGLGLQACVDAFVLVSSPGAKRQSPTQTKSTKECDMNKPEYRFLGGSGLKVSNICLGTMTFGTTEMIKSYQAGRPGQCDEAASHAILDRYAELGGNFLDTADMYSAGTSEEYIGTWLEKQEREKFVVATKVRFNTQKDINRWGLSRHHIMHSINDSLRRLRTDYVDLYQIHWWDEAVPLEETLLALNDLVRAGKVRYLGASNVTGWQLQKIADLSKYMGLHKWISLQAEYSLLCRGIEWELTDVCRREGIGIIPWSPLKGGLLTGKFTREADAPEGTRIAHSTKTGKVSESAPDFEKAKKDEKTWDILDAMKKVAEANGEVNIRLSIAFHLSMVICRITLADDSSARRAGVIKADLGRNQIIATSIPTGTSTSLLIWIRWGRRMPKRVGKTVAQVAIRWLLQKDVVSSVIIGAKTLQQLEDNMGASTGWEISEEQMAELDTVSQMDPMYPYSIISLGNANRVRTNMCQ
ncbi:hypothetical protein Bbelb_074460 [Branchiostoma belcheri]|nr:hypothetical protein Bbelb_074460 [Branchiostoma belcheri]